MWFQVCYDLNFWRNFSNCYRKPSSTSFARILCSLEMNEDCICLALLPRNYVYPLIRPYLVLIFLTHAKWPFKCCRPFFHKTFLFSFPDFHSYFTHFSVRSLIRWWLAITHFEMKKGKFPLRPTINGYCYEGHLEGLLTLIS